MSIRSRLVIMCVVVALLPAVPLSFLVKTLLEKSFRLGLSDTVEESLQSGMVVSRSYMDLVRETFDRDVARVVAGAGTGTVELPRAPIDFGGIDGHMIGDPGVPDESGASGEAGASVVPELPRALAAFAAGPGFREVVREGVGVARREVGRPVDGLVFLEAVDRSIQFAVWTPEDGGRPPVLFYKRTDPAFLAGAGQVIDGRQIFAQLRLTQPTLSHSFFYPFVVIYTAILALSLGLALFMAERLSGPIRRLAWATGKVADGDWRVRLKMRAGGEVGRLIDAFNIMVSRLDAQRRRLTDMEKMATWREMARHLAHEIKNPLLPIRLTVQEIRDQYRGDDGRYREILNDSTRVVDDELNHLTRLVKEFSSFARMPEPSLRTGPIGPLVSDVSALYPQVATRVHEDERVPDATFDHDQFRRVLVNLFDNVVSLAGDGAMPEVRIAIGKGPDGGLTLGFSDNGPGIPADILEKIFEPYFTTRESGSGLGLAMVKNIVLLHGGSIRVESRAGEGTTFRIELPAGGPAGAADESGTSTREREQ